ncbi:sulfotransferase family protein [Pseudomonas agarici]|uniref:sulfotransferase family protein n=1 Tax=Pseudomonas agarici TaxID=46677 RepID=UPI0002E4B736|nr:sulfotransferase [Pseudomonas agarici]NWB93941.1 sulfotransferase [Pseudomonas agarici]NWC11435.1 sulfotransferase [Pseudomonas agarici]
MNGLRSFHFISGLPRSGSTLLSAILLQNPRFHAGMSSPVGGLFNSVLEQCSAGSEFGAVIGTDRRRRLLRGLFESYYADKGEQSVIFDTNRQWSARLPALMDMFAQSKVIACVRNVAWVMDSLERLYRANPFENTKLFNDEVERNTVYSRCETLAQRNRLVGFAWTALKEAYYSEHAGSVLLVDYDLLAQAPERVLRLVYDFIGEPWFEHDFDHLAYDAPEFDQALGVAGLHKVKPKVALTSRRTILPPDLFEKYAELSFWNDGSASAANVIRLKTNAAVS